MLHEKAMELLPDDGCGAGNSSSHGLQQMEEGNDEEERSLWRCKRDGMCDGIYEETWDKWRHRFVCVRVPGTEEWCSCPREAIIQPCRNSFLCKRTEVPAAMLARNRGRCKLCSDNGLMLGAESCRPLPRPHPSWECPGCRMLRRQVCIHPACRVQHAYCLDCCRDMLLLGKNIFNRFECPLCRPLFDMGKK